MGALGCGSRPQLFVDLRTDLAPGLEFVSIEVALMQGDRRVAGGARGATRADDFVEGLRVAELGEIDPGEYAVLVRLLDVDGAVVATRPTLLTIERTYALTVVISRTCAGVSCDDPTALACFAGRCVDSGCRPDRPELCPPPECAADDACTVDVPCAEPRCVEGACFQAAQDDRCARDEWCDVTVGCRSLLPSPPDGGARDGGPPDAGPPDAGPPDAGPPDAGPPDAGPPDAGPPDAGPPDAGTPLDVTYLTSAVLQDSATVHTYPGVPFGAPDGTRVVIVGVTHRQARIVGVSVAGVTATPVVVEDGGRGAAIYVAAVSSGASGDVVVTFDANPARSGVGAWRVVGSGFSSAPFHTARAQALEVALDIPEGGFAIGVSHLSNTGGWSGLTQAYESAYGAGNTQHASGAFDEGMAAQVSRAIGNDRSVAIVAASWAPPPM